MTTPLKPPVRARRVLALREREGHAVLTSQVIDALFRSASVLAEGELDEGTQPPRWYGSALITFHLDRLSGGCRGLEHPDQLERFVAAVEGSVRVRLLAHRVARGQLVERHPDRTIGTAQLESRFRRDGARLHLDIDLEAPVEVASTTRRAR